MFDLGMGELLVIGIVALIVVGPKDLPVMFRTVGKFTGRMKAMAREFTNAMHDAADETGMREVSRDLKKMTSPKAMGTDRLSDITKDIMKWDPEKAPRTRPDVKADAVPETKAETRAETRLAAAPDPKVEMTGPRPAAEGAPGSTPVPTPTAARPEEAAS